MVQQTNLVLTETAERVLKAVEEGGRDWQTRQEIAERIGRNRLYDGEVEALNTLVVNGLIEFDEQRKKAIMVPVYRGR